MIVDLPSLVHPLTEDEFLSSLRRRTPTLVRADSAQRYETLLDWQTLNHLIGTAAYPPDRLQVLQESVPIPALFYVTHRRVAWSALLQFLDMGVRLVFNGLEDYVPRLGTLRHNITARTAEHISVAAVVTSGHAGVAERQFGYEDVVSLQIAGTQRWRVYAEPVLNPVKGMPAPKDPRGAPILDEMVQAGDFLLIPAGYWHASDNGPGRSLHVKVLFDPPNGRDLMTAFSREWISDDTFRRPLTRHASAESLAAHEKALKVCLVDKVRRWSLGDFLAASAASNSSGEIRLEGTTDASPGAPQH